MKKLAACAIFLGSAAIFGVLNSLMSAPPEKFCLGALGSPISTMALTLASASARSSPATMPLRSSRPRPLTGGLSSVTTAVSPSTA